MLERYIFRNVIRYLIALLSSANVHVHFRFRLAHHSPLRPFMYIGWLESIDLWDQLLKVRRRSVAVQFVVVV